MGWLPRDEGKARLALIVAGGGCVILSDMARLPRFEPACVPPHVMQSGGTIVREGRYKTCLADSGHFPTCSRQIERNPVRAWMVVRSNERPWSSYTANAGGRADLLLTPHPQHLGLGSDPASRASAYLALFAEVLPGELVEVIRIHLQQQEVPDRSVPVMG